MSAGLFLIVSAQVSLALLALAVVLTLIRLLRGPTMPDRILALDLLATLTVSLIGVLAVYLELHSAIDIALALCLVGFLATVALARYAARPAGQATSVTPPEAS